MRRFEENLNYSAEGLHKTFRRRDPTAASAQHLHRKPEKIGNAIYANRMGNGPASSGDGYRYRGWGLIQLTGKNNYTAFAAWVGDSSIPSDADQVATKYPVTSAVYYWIVNSINRHADVDDVTRVTKVINGGVNGLADRIKLLNKAKALLNASDHAPSEPAPTPTASLEGATHRVTATTLNFRSSPAVPNVKTKNRIGVLGQGKEVTQVQGADTPPGWVQVRTLLKGVPREGFVSAKFLEPIPGAAAAQPQATETAAPQPVAASVATAFAIPPSHMTENRSNMPRARDGGRVYPIGEANRPGRSGSTPEEKAAQLIAIAKYLDSANPAHKRYQPKSSTTYCNIYAYDYCYLAGVFLPRTWWTGPALTRIAAGQKVPVVYAETVRELNANMLHDWFEDYGAGFGWSSEVSLDSLQAAANEGEVCIILAKRTDPGRSGHIVVVAPEHDNFRAKRDSAGVVLQPVESQAGSRNFRFKASNSHWWQQSKFLSFGYWRHP